MAGSQTDSSWGPCFLYTSPPGKSGSGGDQLFTCSVSFRVGVIVIWGHYLICKPCPTSDSACWDKAWGSAYVVSGPHGYTGVLHGHSGKTESILKTSSQSLMSLQVPSIRLPGAILSSTQNSYTVGPRTHPFFVLPHALNPSKLKCFHVQSGKIIPHFASFNGVL